jgi:hypothetical protein
MEFVPLVILTVILFKSPKFNSLFYESYSYSTVKKNTVLGFMFQLYLFSNVFWEFVLFFC